MEITTAGPTIHVEVDGPADAPPVVVLHGITQSSATWAWLVPHLSDRFRVIRADFRGHGRSDRTPEDYGYDGYVADALAVIDQVAGGPVHLIGHSLGGATSAAIAAHHPDRVRGALLEDPPMNGEDEALETSLLDTFALLRDAVPNLQAAGMTVEQLRDSFGGMATGDGPSMAETMHPDALDAMCEALLQLDASVLDRVLARTLVPLASSATSFSVPVTVVSADPSTPDAAMRAVDVERLRAGGATVHVVEGSGHLIHDGIETRAVLLGHIEDFLAGAAG